MGGFFAERDSRNPLSVSADDHRADTQQFCCSTDELVTIDSHFFHEVNNRLLIIQFACAKLINGLSSDDLNHSTVVAIEEARQQAADLIHQFREAKKKELAKGSMTDLNEIVCRLKPLITRAAHEDVIVNTDLTSKPALVFVHQETVERILLHLILGAMAVISDCGWLTIHTSHTDGVMATTSDLSTPSPSHFVRLSISDTSCEAAESTATELPANENVLSNAVNNAVMRRTTIENVSKIVRECGGQISLTTSEEAGTRIDILLPKVPIIELPLMPAFAHPQNTRGSETILLVDDDARVRKFIKCALESHGYNVLEAHDGDSAINVATEHSEPLHLLVTDLRLAEASGCDIADRLRSEYPGLPVVFMSGLASDDLALDASSTFLEKPFKPIDLITRVRRLLDASRSAAVSELRPKND